MDDIGDLIDRLCCESGKIMEDASALAVRIGPTVNRSAKIAQLAAAARDVGLLAGAVVVLERRSENKLSLIILDIGSPQKAGSGCPRSFLSAAGAV